jgi:hypothetical protein
MPRTLYICYFGVREPLVQTQVLPYLREIGKGKSKKAKGKSGEEEFIKVSLLTFEPRRGEEDLREFEEIREALAGRASSGTGFPITKGFRRSRRRGMFFAGRFISGGGSGGMMFCTAGRMWRR